MATPNDPAGSKRVILVVVVVLGVILALVGWYRGIGF